MGVWGKHLCRQNPRLTSNAQWFTSVASSGNYLEADLLVERYGSVAEGNGIAEAGQPLDRLLGQIHDDKGALGIWMKEQRADRKVATLDGQAPLGFVVTSV